MSDFELTRRAFKSAFHGAELMDDKDMLHKWSPLTDDGDAFRLMAALNLNLGFDGTEQGVEVAVMAVWDGGPDAVSEVFEGNDAAPAMRRAIVRAAAAMGEAHD
ncbi:hypothetical protein [Halomonas elongata]|uniref:hypothetical protein n=1 Tax=Halomonas elongata TaxID=2746 RepID=UPI0023B1FB75|nr:hypothetical protein [Halomonas elongata]